NMSKLLFVFFALVTTILLYDGESVFFSERIYISSLLIQYVFLYYIFSNDSRPYSLNKIFYLFCFFFFGVSPFIQSISNTSSFGARVLNEGEYFTLNVLILLIMFCYQFFYEKFDKLNFNQNN